MHWPSMGENTPDLIDRIDFAINKSIDLIDLIDFVVNKSIDLIDLIDFAVING